MNDTHPAALKVQIELLQRLGAEGRAAMAMRLSTDVIARSKRALVEAMPGATERERAIRWVELWYGRELAERLQARLPP